MQKQNKNFNVTVAFGDGTYSHTQNLKAESEKDAIRKIIDSPLYEKSNNIVSITILEKKPYYEDGI